MKYHLFTLLTLTVGGSLMGGLLLLLRGRPSKLPRSFFYYAWLLVLLRLALPVPGLMALALPRLSAPPAQVEETVSHQTPEAAPVLPAADTALPTQPIQPERVPSPVPAAPQSAREAPEAPLPGKDPFPLYDGLALVWALGFVLVLGRDLVGYWRFRAVLRKTLKPAKASDLAVYNALTGTRRPRLRRSAAVDTPMLMGVFRPLLLLPDRDYNEETLTCIFKHELTHFRRGDILVKWLAMPVLAVHWFNPLTFFMGREIDRFCELSCDERILKNMDKDQRRQYGQTLLVLAARTTTARNTLATTFSTEKKNLKERLVQIMNFSPKSKKAILAAALLLVMVAGCLLAFGPGSQPSRDGVVRNVDELLEAIDSNAAIILEPGTYDLTTAKTYGMANVSDRYHWEDRIDGYQLVIDKVENLTITGRDMERCQIVTAPRYAAVLSFDGAANVTLSSFTAGHSEGPGNCVGPVVQVNNCQAMTVRDCVLYGCGTRGLDGYDSANVEVLNCDIKECSLGGVYFMSCDNIQVRECRIYDCGHSEDFQAYDLFSFLQCRNALVQNCQVRSNRADRLMLTLTSQNVWFLGNRVEQNQLDCLFRVDGTAPMVADCAFDALTDEPVKGSFELLDSVSSPDGAQLSAGDLGTMVYAKSDFVMPLFEAAPRPDLTPIDGTIPEDTRVVEVSTVDEFLAAIAPDTTIVMKEGTYDLSTATDYGTGEEDYYIWSSTSTLRLRGLNNFHIRGAGKGRTVITAVPRIADVLWFTNCDAISIAGITAGHTEEPDTCTGNVLNFRNCQEVRIDGCGLYGCGIRGIDAEESRYLDVTNTEIYECSLSAVNLFFCEDVRFEDCDIHDCPQPYFGTSVSGCKNVTVDGKLISDK